MGCTESREIVLVPSALSSLSRQDWLVWKKSFISYMDYKGVPNWKRGEKFFKYIGFLGEEISQKFYFATAANETKYEVLLFKFDVYFIFRSNDNVRKTDIQNFEQYVSVLKNIAYKVDNERVNEIVKEKILQDFKSKNLFDKLEKLDLNSRITNYENLVVHELLFLWKECDNLEPIQTKKSCRFCSRQHQFGKCYAMGKTCRKCGGIGHFARCCHKTFVTKCIQCGSNHKVNTCPANAMECSKCKRLNHFSWMCNTEMVTNCIYCGGSHRSGRNYCFARHSSCRRCGKIGHYTSHCFRVKV